MISYIRGTLTYADAVSVVTEAGGIGYKIYITSAVASRLPRLGDEVLIYTFMSVKDDGITLFGFSSEGELELFNMLIGVSGLGPKSAVSLLSAFSADELTLAIISDDTSFISKAPGIGKKTAQRIVLDLKDKLSPRAFLPDGEKAASDSDTSFGASVSTEAIAALTVLGYSRSEASNAVSKAYKPSISVEQLLKDSLRNLNRL